MVWHDHPGVQPISLTIKKSQRTRCNVGDLSPLKPASTLPSVQKFFDFAEIVPFDPFQRIVQHVLFRPFLNLLLRMVTFKPLRAFCLIFKKHFCRQRIRQAEGHKVTRTFPFHVWQKTSSVNPRSQWICRFRFDATGPKFKFYSFNSWIFFLGKHLLILRPERPINQHAIGQQATKSSCGRSAELHSAVSQICNPARLEIIPTLSTPLTPSRVQLGDTAD